MVIDTLGDILTSCNFKNYTAMLHLTTRMTV